MLYKCTYPLKKRVFTICISLKNVSGKKTKPTIHICLTIAGVWNSNIHFELAFTF